MKLKICIFLLACTACWFQTDERYVLPYPKGVSYKILQSWNGPWGHSDHASFAYDFNMPIGSYVVASRSGVVAKTVEEFEDGNKTPGKENFIVIDHGDSTFSRYYHLTKQGALVQKGDRVTAGDTIGLSGNTGASAGPHLHFDVTRDCYEWGCKTIPFDFIDVNKNPLKVRMEYKAN